MFFTNLRGKLSSYTGMTLISPWKSSQTDLLNLAHGQHPKWLRRIILKYCILGAPIAIFALKFLSLHTLGEFCKSSSSLIQADITSALPLCLHDARSNSKANDIRPIVQNNKHVHYFAGDQEKLNRADSKNYETPVINTITPTCLVLLL